MSIHDFRFFFDRIEYLRLTGKGFSLFRASDQIIEQFKTKCVEGKSSYRSVQLSTAKSFNSNELADGDIIIVFQDLPYSKFIVGIQDFVDKLIFPLWYKKKTICFFSTLDKTEYSKKHITSSSIHTDYDGVVRFLLCEQMMNLLDRVNYQFTSPEFLSLNADKTIFTPIELILKIALEKASLGYEPQVKIGRHFVDFLVTHKSQRIIVECDGRAYHTIERDSERDKILLKEGHPVLHLSGSEIYTNVENCIDAIKSDGLITQRRKFEIDADLDESQKKAQAFITGPIRVLAPAGSGKTKTLINRVVNLINSGIPPERILALAFNKKASEEMKLRLANKQITAVEVLTFHALGLRIVRDNLRWPFDGQNENAGTRDLLRQAVQKHIQLPHKRNWDSLDVFLDALRRTKMELPPISEVNVEVGEKLFPFEPIFKSYVELQYQHNFFNFDDMIYLAIRILLNDDSLRSHYQNQFQYLLVDEFQDLNRAQLLFLQMLSLPENNVFIVGDDDQMIYGWRGAEVRHIIDFHKRYPVSQDCTLSTNYRSSRKIVYHSKWLIDHNKDRVPKNIHPRVNAPKGQFHIELYDNLWEQAVSATEWITKCKTDNKLQWKDFAVLFRLNAYQFPLAMVFDSKQIPHSPVNGNRLFKTRVGRDVYSYLSVILHSRDATIDEYEVILKRPNKYFTNEIISSVTDWTTFRNASEIQGLRGWEREKLADFFRRIEELSRLSLQPTTLPHSLLNQIDIEIGLSAFYKDQSRLSTELDDASDDILFEVIISVAKNFERLDTFYEYIHQAIQNDSSTSEHNEQSNRNEVSLTTIHKTKGNEYFNVVYFNLSQDARLTEESDIEEERRVAYVGVTRARESMFITALKDKPSMFLLEVAFNPELKSLSTVKLQSDISSTSRQLSKLQHQVNIRQIKKNHFLAKFPELTGKHGNISYSLLTNAISWWREKRIEAASRKIDFLEAEILKLTEDQIRPLSERIEFLETEVQFRNKIPKK
jgi:DNA helicase-2/ATP-dependent DNA helicase PcrA